MKETKETVVLDAPDPEAFNLIFAIFTNSKGENKTMKDLLGSALKKVILVCLNGDKDEEFTITNQNNSVMVQIDENTGNTSIRFSSEKVMKEFKDHNYDKNISDTGYVFSFLPQRIVTYHCNIIEIDW